MPGCEDTWGKDMYQITNIPSTPAEVAAFENKDCYRDVFPKAKLTAFVCLVIFQLMCLEEFPDLRVRKCANSQYYLAVYTITEECKF